MDTDNHTISVEVDSLSPFIAAVVQSDSSGGDSGGDGGDAGTGSNASETGGGSSGGCFISSTASVSGTGGIRLLTGISLAAMMLGLGAALHATITRFK